MTYIVAISNHSKAFEEKVNALMQEGYRPTAGFAVAEGCYFQPMIKLAKAKLAKSKLVRTKIRQTLGPP